MNVVDLAKQAADGVAPELRKIKPTKKNTMPWIMDAKLQETGFANEAVSGCTLGHGRSFFVVGKGIASNGSTEGADLNKVKKSNCHIIEGMETMAAAGHILFCDALRSKPGEKIHFMTKAQFESHSDFSQLYGPIKFVFTHPGVGATLLKMMMKSKIVKTDGDEAMQVPAVDLEAFRPESLFEDLPGAQPQDS